MDWFLEYRHWVENAFVRLKHKQTRVTRYANLREITKVWWHSMLESVVIDMKCQQTRQDAFFMALLQEAVKRLQWLYSSCSSNSWNNHKLISCKARIHRVLLGD